MSFQETFEIGAIAFDFSADSRVECRDGVLNAVLVAEPQRFDADKHRVFKDQSGVVRPSVRIRRLTFATTTVERTLQLPEASDEISMTLEGFSGMFTPRALGTLRVADGWLILDGALDAARPEQRAPLTIRKRFDPGPVDPRLHVHSDLSYALRIQPTLVCRLALLQSGQSIPTDLFELHHLRDLTLRYFSAETLPDLFERLPNLTRLTLMNMPLKELPPSIGALTSLTELDIYETHLEQLPEAVCNLNALERISIGASRLGEVPDCLFRLPALRIVSLSWNKLASLPESVGTSAVLQEIYLEGNSFTRLPRSLANVPNVFIEAKFKPLYTKAAYKSRNRKKIDQALFSAAANGELAGARRALVLNTTHPDDYSTVGNTRFGGDPDLPRAAKYPTIDDEPLVFLAQIDLAEVAAHQAFLPRTGLLSFFALLVEEDGFAPAVKVLYFPQASDLVRCDSMQVAAYEEEPFRGFRAVATPCFSLPQLADQTRNSHGINTFVDTQLHTPEELACEVHGGVPDEWLVLLSVSSDEKPGFCFVDGGTLTFCVHKRDLAIDDFSKVVASVESS